MIDLTMTHTLSGIYNMIKSKEKEKNFSNLRTVALCSSKNAVDSLNSLLVHLLLLVMNQTSGLKGF